MGRRTQNVVDLFCRAVRGDSRTVNEAQSGTSDRYVLCIRYSDPHDITDAKLRQLVSYVRIKSLKYGFLCTYRYTIFVRRTATYRWELSIPIRENSKNFSVRKLFKCHYPINP